MGLGDGPRWWDDYEWVDPASPLLAAPAAPRAAPAQPAPSADAPLRAADLTEALREQVDEEDVWAVPGRRTRGLRRLLLVDLDNLRAGPIRWAARMGVVVDLAREADDAALAGQVGPVERSLPHLEEFAVRATAVPDGSDLADHALLDAARAVAAAYGGPGHVVVASNDGIFADLVDEGWVLTVLSPGRDALSDRLRDAAARTVDLVDAERTATRRWRSRALRESGRRRARTVSAAAGRGSTRRRRAATRR